MDSVYLAINGDDVGGRIGEAIANDDHEGLAQASSSIKNAHDNIDKWVNSIGGKKITSSGDDGIYLIPSEAVDSLDSIRDSYKERSGHGLTMGVGSSMSQASKALIYGKLNGKDQTIHYEPSIEDYLSDEDQEEPVEVPEESDLRDQADADIEAEQGLGEMEELSEESEEGDEESEEGDEESEEGDEDDVEMSPEGVNEDEVSEDDPMVADSPEAPMAHKTPMQEAADEEEIDGKTDKDFGTSSEDMAEDTESLDEDSEDMDMPDTDVEDDAAAEQAEEDMAETEVPESDEEDMIPDEDSESMDDEDPLASMIHGDMQDEDADESMDENESSSTDDELRNDIATALMSFKENKDMLEQARETNPELYQATLTMLRSMIEMAKKLGYSPKQDMEEQQNVEQLDEEFPEAEGQEQDAGMSEDEESEEMPEAIGQPRKVVPGKK